MPNMEIPRDASIETPTDIFRPLCFSLEAVIVVINVLPVATVYAWKSCHERLAIDELIVALSITDMLSVLLPSPLSLMSYFTDQWYGGARTCDLFQLTTAWFQGASMTLVTFMCVDRILAIRLAAGSNKPCSRSTDRARVRACVLIAYALSLALAVLPMFGLAPQALSASGRSCQPWLVPTPRTHREHTYYICFLVAGYSNLLIALTVCGAGLVALWRFWYHLEPTNGVTTRGSETALQVDRKSIIEFTAMTSTVTLTFYAAWLPTLVLTTLQKSGHSVPAQAMQYGLMSTTLTGLLNPVIYAVFSPTYRRGYGSSVCAVSRFLFGCPLSRSQIIRATTAGGSVASFAALLSSRASDASDTISVGQMSNSHSQSSDVALLATGARISSVTELYGGVHASDVASRSSVRDDASSRAYCLTAAALYRDLYGSELSVVSDVAAEDASKGVVDYDDGDTECEVQRENRLTHTVTIEESVI